jgi:hypothetical protein
MARIRSIKPEFWDDRRLAKRTSRDARLLYIGLWNLADEHSRLNGDPQWLKGQIFSFDDDIDAKTVAGLLDELDTAGRIVRYDHDGDPYIFLPFLARHQRLEPKVKSRLPPPPEPYASQFASDADESARDADQSESSANKSSLLYGAGGRGHGAGGRGTRVTPTPLGCSLLDEHLAQVKPRPPRDVVEATANQVERLLLDGMAEAEIAEALGMLRKRVDVGPGMLPSFVHEVRQRHAHPELANGRASPPRRPSTTDQRVGDAQALKAQFRDEPQPDPPPNTIPGSVIR